MKTAQVNGERIIVNNVEDITLQKYQSGISNIETDLEVQDKKAVLSLSADKMVKKGAVVKVLGCGLCGSDIVKLKHKIVNDGAVLGHEIVAEILEIDSDTNFKKGDRIVTSHHIPCGKCDYCRHGNVSMCEHFKKTNIIPGGFSEKVFVSEEHLKNVAYLIPENISEEEISFYEPLGCCIRAIKRASLLEGDTALVVGLGSIGLLMGEGLKAMGYKVYGCDLIPERIVLANKMGIETFNPEIKVDAVFMTSGADKAIDTAIKSVKQGGKIVVFSSTPLNNGYQNNEIYYKELTVMGSYSPSPQDLKDSYDLLASGMVNVKGLTTTYPLDKIQQAFDDTVSNKIFKAYIKISD